MNISRKMRNIRAGYRSLYYHAQVAIRQLWQAFDRAYNKRINNLPYTVRFLPHAVG